MEEKTPMDTARIVSKMYVLMIVFVITILWLAGVSPWSYPYQVYLVFAGFAILFAVSGFFRYKFKNKIQANSSFFGYLILGLGILQFIFYTLAEIIDSGFSIVKVSISLVAVIAFSSLGLILIKKSRSSKSSLK